MCSRVLPARFNNRPVEGLPLIYHPDIVYDIPADICLDESGQKRVKINRKVERLNSSSRFRTTLLQFISAVRPAKFSVVVELNLCSRTPVIRILLKYSTGITNCTGPRFILACSNRTKFASRRKIVLIHIAPVCGFYMGGCNGNPTSASITTP